MKAIHNVFNRVTQPKQTTQVRVHTQAKPAVGTFAWFPQRDPTYRVQPHERGTFFYNLGRSGMGGVGIPSAPFSVGNTTNEIVPGTNAFLTHNNRQRRIVRMGRP